MRAPSAESKAERIARILESEIRSGALIDGTVLSSENNLVQRFSVSRSTVRKGLGILSSKGLIETKVGIGSFVTFGGDVIDSQAGWSIALSDKGAKIGTRILRIARIGMDLGAPDLPAGSDVLAVDRIRFREETGRALSLERARVPWRDGFAAALEQGLTEGSLSKTMAAQNLIPTGGEEWANVLPALTADDASIMSRAEGEPMLRLRRQTRNDAGQVVEYVESLLDPELFALQMTF